MDSELFFEIYDMIRSGEAMTMVNDDSDLLKNHRGFAVPINDMKEVGTMTKGHHVFDHAIQEANIWLKSVETQLHCSEREAYQALRATLQALRDSLPLENAVKLAAQLPVLIRGVYYEGWHLAAQMSGGRSEEEFSRRLKEILPDRFPMDSKRVAAGVFEVIGERIDPGETTKIADLMPASLRHLWLPAAIR